MRMRVMGRQRWGWWVRYLHEQLIPPPLIQQSSSFSSSTSSLSSSSCSSLTFSSDFSVLKKTMTNDDDDDEILFPIEWIRNFSIIAHIDHGKSTLAQALLERAGNLLPAHGNKNSKISSSSSDTTTKTLVLDSLQVEQERGITVKAQSASMLVRIKSEMTQQNRISNEEFRLLNLIDTPGHVDFSFEVQRSLAACEGALLLVDASQGVQAQTLANYQVARNLGLTIIPILTKVDTLNADPEERIFEMALSLDLDPESILLTSAKKRIGIDAVFQAVIDQIPPPTTTAFLPSSEATASDSNTAQPLVASKNHPQICRCSLLDAVYDEYRGIVCMVKVVDGHLQVGDTIHSILTGESYIVQELGLLLPDRLPMEGLFAGQVGYVVSGMKKLAEATTGDTLYSTTAYEEKTDITAPIQVEPLKGFKPTKSMVFASIFPMDEITFDELRTAVDRICLTDASVSVEVTQSKALGMGFKVGFLGVLHMDVFRQRLMNEQNMHVLVTAPMVPYTIASSDGKTTRVIEVADEFDELKKQDKILEPMVEATITFPSDYMGELLPVLEERGRQTDMSYLEDGHHVCLVYELPWQEVVTDLYDELKSRSSGYATMTYMEIEPQASDVVKIDILLNGSALDALSFVCHRSKAVDLGRAMCEKMIQVIDRQQYEVVIQAALGSKILSRKRLAPYRKNVLVKSGKNVGGGDITRKQKLLAKQREGKKRMKTVSNIQLPQEAFWSALSK